MIVYLITNKINGKRYVGQTSLSLEKRWSLHRYRKTCPAMIAAIKKYGPENFEPVVLFDGLNKEQADEFEKEYISRYNTKAPNGYNLTDGGDGLFNPSIEVRQRLSLLMRGNRYAFGAKRTPEYCKFKSESQKGRVFSSESLKKMSMSASKRKASKETKEKLSIERKTRGVRPPKRTSEEAAAAGRISGHKRYHVDRNVINPKCLLCREGNNQ